MWLHGSAIFTKISLPMSKVRHLNIFSIVRKVPILIKRAITDKIANHYYVYSLLIIAGVYGKANLLFYMFPDISPFLKFAALAGWYAVGAILIKQVMKRYSREHEHLIIMTALQISLIPLLSFMLPVKYFNEWDGSHKHFTEVTCSIYILMGFLSLVGIMEIVLKIFNQKQQEGKGKKEVLSSILLSFLLLPLVNFTSHGFLPSDDYHFGERLMPYFLYNNYGRVPYVTNNIPAHGFSDMISAFLADVFTTANPITAQSVLYGYSLSLFFSTMVSFWIWFNLFSPRASGFSLLCVGNPISYMLYASFFSKKIVQNECLWIVLYVFVGFSMVLFEIGIGAAMALSLTPLALFMIYQIIIQKKYLKIKNITLFAMSLLLALILIVRVPIIDISLGVINILLENSSINLDAFGVPWKNSYVGYAEFGEVHFVPSLLKSITNLDFPLRSLWIFISPIMIMTSVCFFRKKMIFLSISMFSAFLFSILIMPYSLGRIDPLGMSRTGESSFCF